MDIGDLRDALRAARARTSPESVGLPRGKRRRVPGLRREEVAELAGMSTEWYARCEAGTARFSLTALDRVCRVLRFDASERRALLSVARPELQHTSSGCDAFCGTAMLRNVRDASRRISAASGSVEIGDAVTSFLLQIAETPRQAYFMVSRQTDLIFESVDGLWRDDLIGHAQPPAASAHIADRLSAGLLVAEADLSRSPSLEFRERQRRLGASRYAALGVLLEPGTPWAVLGYAAAEFGEPSPFEAEVLYTIGAIIESVGRR